MSDTESINVDEFRTAANKMRAAYGHHNAVCTLTDLLLRSLAKIESGAKVIAAFRDCPCPRPANSDPDDTTIGQCLDLKHCGCCYGSALATIEQTAGEK